jgi:hypothetical protein
MLRILRLGASGLVGRETLRLALGRGDADGVVVTQAGVELARRIRKRQFSFGPGRQRRGWSLEQLWDRALATLKSRSEQLGSLCFGGRHRTRTVMFGGSCYGAELRE